MKNNKGSLKKAEQIFEEMEQYDDDYSSSEQKPRQNEKHLRAMSQGQEQEGEIVEEDYSPDIPAPSQQQLSAINKNKVSSELYQDSSQEDNDRLEIEKKKREEFWRNKLNKGEQVGERKKLTETQLMEMALNAVQKTNKRVMLMRKKNEKRMQDLQKIRMTQQPYLTTGNTHFRGSSSQYSIITQDSSGKSYLHPNHSFRVGEMKLQNFILKNIKEESTANYLNEVVKFENYAYQQRKKRRHHIQ